MVSPPIPPDTRLLIVGARCEDEYLKSWAERIVHFPHGKTEYWSGDCCVVVLPSGLKYSKTRIRISIPGASTPGGSGSAAGTVAAVPTSESSTTSSSTSAPSSATAPVGQPEVVAEKSEPAAAMPGDDEWRF
jgi:hypothetical protein